MDNLYQHNNNKENMDAEQTTENTTQKPPEIEINESGRPVNLVYGPQTTQPKISDIVPQEETEETPTDSSEDAPVTPDVIKGSYQDETLDVPLEARFDIGLDEKPTFNQLTARYKEEDRIRQRNGALGSREDIVTRKEAKLQKEMALLSDMTNEITKAAAVEDVQGLFRAIAAFNPDTDPSEIINNVMKTLLPEAERRLNMDAEELAAEDLKISNQHAREALAARRASLEAQKAETSDQEAVQEILRQGGVTQAEYLKAASELDNMAKSGQLEPERLAKLRAYNPQQMARELVECVQGSKIQAVVEEVIRKTAPERIKDDKLFSTLYGVIRNPYRNYQVTEQDLVDIINGNTGNGSVNTKANGVETQAPEAVITKEPEPVTPTPDHVVVPTKVDPEDPKTWTPLTVQQLFDPRFNSR